MTKYEMHPVVNIFPMMTTDQYRKLVEDIKQNGLLEPIWLDTDGARIIDGRHRYRACLELGIEPRFRNWSGEGELVAFVISLNMHRRHLRPAQKAFAAARSLSYFKEKAKERKLAGVSAGEEAGKAADKTATVFGVSGRMVERADAVLKGASTSLLEAVEDGLCSLDNAVLIVKNYDSDKQDEIVAAGKVSLVAAARSKKRPKKRRVLTFEKAMDKVYIALNGLSADDLRCVINNINEMIEMMPEGDAHA